MPERQGHYGAAIHERRRVLELIRARMIRTESEETRRELEYLFARIRSWRYQRIVYRGGRRLVLSRIA